MSVSDHLANVSGLWRGAPLAKPEAIAALVAASPIELPSSYLELLALTNGGEGDLRMEPGWVSLWPAEEVMRNNEQYEVGANIPRFLGFGSNGGGELLAFDARDSQPWPIVMVPFIPMEPHDVVVIARDFNEFLEAIGVPANDR
jgi:SMI1/KNR4 family protein SUKH-1